MTQIAPSMRLHYAITARNIDSAGPRVRRQSESDDLSARNIRIMRRKMVAALSEGERAQRSKAGTVSGSLKAAVLSQHNQTPCWPILSALSLLSLLPLSLS